MEVYADVISGVEYFSNAKPIKPVTTGGKEEEKVDGLVFVPTQKQAVDGGDVDIGRGNEFGGGADDEEADDGVETKLDHLIAFPDLQEEPVPYASFKQFRDEFFKGYVKGLQKTLKDNGTFASKEDQTAFQTRVKGIMDWIKANFSDMDIYQAALPTTTVVNDAGEEKEVFNSVIFAHWAEGLASPNFCFMSDAYKMTKF